MPAVTTPSPPKAGNSSDYDSVLAKNISSEQPTDEDLDLDNNLKTAEKNYKTPLYRILQLHPKMNHMGTNRTTVCVCHTLLLEII